MVMMTERERMTAEIEGFAEKFGRNRSAMLPILQEIQRKYHYVSSYAMQVVANQIKVHPVEVYSVVTFYGFIHSQKQGRFIIRLCKTISCDLKEKDRVARQLENDLGIRFGETTSDGAFTLEYVSCMGMCDQGPALLVNEKLYTHVSPEIVANIIEECRSQFGVHAMERKVTHI